MSTDNRRIIQAAWRAFASHDAEQITAFFTEDAEWLAPAGNATAVALDGPSHMIGRDAITHFLAHEFPRLFVNDVAVEFHGFYVDGYRVIVEETMSATLANGNTYRNDYCFVFELQDGLIHRVREYLDTARGHRDVFTEPKQIARRAKRVSRYLSKLRKSNARNRPRNPTGYSEVGTSGLAG